MPRCAPTTTFAVAAVAPGLTDTRAARAGMHAAAFDDVLARQALPRTLRPEDVAATVAFLATTPPPR